MSRTERFDVVVIGGGATGSEVAFQLGRRSGLRVALVERELLGGECNHFGCVPTKVMLKSAKIAADARRAAQFGVRIDGDVEVDLRAIQERARHVVETSAAEGAAPFERIGVTVVLQEARLAGARRVELADGTVLETERVVLATGTEATIPPIPGLADGPRWTNREAIWEPERRPTRLAVIGSGAIGVEFAQIYARFGSSVTLLEAFPHILPREDPAVATAMMPALRRDGIDVRAGATIERADHRAGTWTLALADDGTVEADAVLVAAGRRPVFDGHDLAAAGVDLDERGLPVLGPTLRTTADGVWAAGDATGDLLFTHVGSYEAEVVVDDILGTPRERDYRVVPRITFSDPEVASVGLTEPQARDAGYEVATAESAIEDNERSHIDGHTEGLVKLVADAASGRLLGGHVVATEAAAMIHEIAVAMAGDVPAEVVGATIHAYPTLSESVKGAFEELADHLGA
jgi:pyruvate/2-oxoglutarate dehydrogenase complex dihydrolipoamide dehydrogenase (E3) component